MKRILKGTIGFVPDKFGRDQEVEAEFVRYCAEVPRHIIVTERRTGEERLVERCAWSAKE